MDDAGPSGKDWKAEFRLKSDEELIEILRKIDDKSGLAEVIRKILMERNPDSANTFSSAPSRPAPTALSTIGTIILNILILGPAVILLTSFIASAYVGPSYEYTTAVFFFFFGLPVSGVVLAIFNGWLYLLSRKPYRLNKYRNGFLYSTIFWSVLTLIVVLVFYS